MENGHWEGDVGDYERRLKSFFFLEWSKERHGRYKRKSVEKKNTFRRQKDFFLER